MHARRPTETDPLPQSDPYTNPNTIDRTFSRQLFREMAKSEMETEPLSWRKRRDFVKFAERMGIDEFEARLILRAVEYECGHVELAALDERNSKDQQRLVANGDGFEEFMNRSLVHPVFIVAAALIAWIALRRY